MNSFKIINIIFIFLLIVIIFFLFFNNSSNKKINQDYIENKKYLFQDNNIDIDTDKEENFDKDIYYIISDNKKFYFKNDKNLNFNNLIDNNEKNLEEDQELGIYVDFIYNPNFNSELKIIQYMLLEILNKTKINFFYDYENLSNSTIITTGFEEGYIINKKKNLITIKPKLLKDILYNENIFLRIYILIYNFFRIGQKYNTIPEYDRTINYKRYKKIFSEELKKLDHVNFNNMVCRNELIYKYKNKFCIKSLDDYIDKSFKNINVSRFYKIFLYRIGWFVSQILSHNTNLINIENNIDCYDINIYPEIDINRVLLLPHAAVITASPDEDVVENQDFFNKLILLIITIKHRILHSLGLIHKYSMQSVMANYENNFQKNNIFFIMMEDYEALNNCYGNYIKPPRFVKNYQSFNSTLYNLFVYNFEKFKYEYLIYF